MLSYMAVTGLLMGSVETSGFALCCVKGRREIEKVLTIAAIATAAIALAATFAFASIPVTAALLVKHILVAEGGFLAGVLFLWLLGVMLQKAKISARGHLTC